MEFHIGVTGTMPDVGAVEDAIFAVDQAAIVDVDPTGHTLRISAAVTATELTDLMRQAGYPVSAEDVVQLPSICCGGCSG